MKAHLLPPSTRHHCNEFNQRFHSFHIHTCLLANSGVKKQVYGVPSWRSQQRKASSIVGYSFAEMMKNKKNAHTNSIHSISLAFMQHQIIHDEFRINSACPTSLSYIALASHVCRRVRLIGGPFFVPPSRNDTFSCVIHYKTCLIWWWWRKPERNNFVLMIIWLIPSLEQYNHVTYSTVAVPSELRCYGIRVADSRGAR